MPEDIHQILWSKVIALIKAGRFAVTREIYDELVRLPGSVGDCIKASEKVLVCEVGDNDWDWGAYIGHVNRMRLAHKAVISEYNGNRKGTIGLIDLSIVALARTLRLPVVSMESESFQVSATRVRIPRLCTLEGVTHRTFNELLRGEGIKN